MKIKFDRLKNLTNFGETLIDYIPFFGFFYRKNMGVEFIFGFYIWTYSFKLIKKK